MHLNLKDRVHPPKLSFGVQPCSIIEKIKLMMATPKSHQLTNATAPINKPDCDAPYMGAIIIPRLEIFLLIDNEAPTQEPYLIGTSMWSDALIRRQGLESVNEILPPVLAKVLTKCDGDRWFFGVNNNGSTTEYGLTYGFGIKINRTIVCFADSQQYKLSICSSQIMT